VTRALLVRSIPLSKSTRNAWHNAGAIFTKRSREADSVPLIARGRPIVNLGNQRYLPSTINNKTWNKANDISVLLSPTSSRYLFGQFMPSNEWQGPGYYWTKGIGYGGANKTRKYHEIDDLPELSIENNCDVQQHINGTEYRVITVTNKVVQVSERHGENGNRSYSWVGVSNAPRGLIPLAKQAAAMLSGKNVIGWDLIVDAQGNWYILEGNACPGVNTATANRILDEIERQEQE